MNKIDIIEEAKKTFDIEIYELEKLRNKVDNNFKKMVNLIIKLENKKVIVTGIGKSGHIGSKIAATLASTGTSAIFVNAAEALHGDLGMINEGDVVIIISNSGNSDEILSILAPIKKLGAYIIGFTGNLDSLLAKKSDIVINIGIEKEACPLGIAPMSSTTSTLVMGDALAVCLMKLRNFSERDFAKYHPGGSLGKRLLLTVEDLMYKEDTVPLALRESSIEEILLILTEKKQGAVCIVDNLENKELLGIITEGDIRRALLNKKDFFNYKAKDIMKVNPIFINPNIMAIDALNIMEKRESQISVLPVIKDKKIVGIIRVHDLVGLR